MRLSNAQSGFAIECGDNKTAVLGTCGNFSSLVDGAFAIVFDAKFEDKNENYFFGGTGTGTNFLYLARNVGNSNDDSITFDSADASGDHRTVKWGGIVANYDWNNYIFNSSAFGAGNLKLYLNGLEKTITSQTNDAGFSVTEDYSLSFGEVYATHASLFRWTRVYFYNRVLTVAEIANIQLGVYPDDYIKAFLVDFPHRGLNEALPEWVNV